MYVKHLVQITHFNWAVKFRISLFIVLFILQNMDIISSSVVFDM